jgi:MraZ protein
MAFRGQHEHSLDAKDRITVPARYRAPLAEGVVLIAGLEKCVEVYPAAAAEQLEERYLKGLNPFSRKGRLMSRRFYSSSEEVELDSAGRVKLPRHLIDHAGLDGACVVAGAGSHLEVWAPGAWDPERDEFEASAVEMAEELATEDARPATPPGIGG